MTLIASLAVSACTTGPPPPPPLIAAPEIAPSIPTGGGIYKIGEPYQVEGVWYYPREDAEYNETGIGSWYGAEFHGRITANGEIFDRNAITAAHPTLPLPVNARVTNLENGLSLVVRINDRGPFVNGRVIDLSEGAAELLGYREQGTARVQVTFLGRAELDGNGTLGVGAGTPPEVAYAVPAAPTSIVAATTLAPVAGAAIAPARPVEALPRSTTQQAGAASNLPSVDGVVTQMAVSSLSQPYAPAEALVLNTPSVSASAPTQFVGEPAQPSPRLEELVSNPTDSILAPESPLSEIYVQAGAFDDFTNANRVASRLAFVGARISRIEINGTTLYRVRIGPYQDVTTADAVLAQVQSAGHTDVQIVVE